MTADEQSFNKIVITGGPSGGKTTLIEAIKKELGKEVKTVPEAASLLYRGGLPRAQSAASMAHVQRAIYYLQRELEGLAQDEHPVKTIVCDRGSLDGLAYWPTTAVSFFESVGSTEPKEISRYHWVLHLDTATHDSYETTNPLRIENYDEAWKLNQMIKTAWSRHPRQLIVPPRSDFISKMALCLQLIRNIMRGQKYEELKRELQA
jgi:predicted ATPase